MSENLTRIHLETSREGMPLSISGAALSAAPATTDVEAVDTTEAAAEVEATQA